MKFTLQCDNDHRFEGWFRSNEDYETQAKRGFVECPQCGSIRIAKTLMAPQVATGRSRDARKEAVMVAACQAIRREMLDKMREVTRQVKAQAHDVGARFPEEARKMHYGETDAKPIYGRAAPKEVESLVEEGVEIMPLPDLPEELN